MAQRDIRHLWVGLYIDLHKHVADNNILAKQLDVSDASAFQNSLRMFL